MLAKLKELDKQLDGFDEAQKVCQLQLNAMDSKLDAMKLERNELWDKANEISMAAGKVYEEISAESTKYIFNKLMFKQFTWHKLDNYNIMGRSGPVRQIKQALFGKDAVEEFRIAYKDGNIFRISFPYKGVASMLITGDLSHRTDDLLQDLGVVFDNSEIFAKIKKHKEAITRLNKQLTSTC